ncbi:hypothetical protein D3C85_915020 [compost metagenome]
MGSIPVRSGLCWADEVQEADAMEPGDTRRDQQQRDCWYGATANNEQVGENSKAHGDREQQPSQSCEDGYEQGDSSADFDQSRQDTEPLTQANMFEDLEHH